MAKYTSIGGQALIEGIMMRNPQKKTALAVRKPDKTIDITYINEKSIRDKYAVLRLPIIRGVVSYIEAMIQGYKAMMMSADISGFTDVEDGEKQKTENGEKKQSVLTSVIMVVATVLMIYMQLLFSIIIMIIIIIQWLLILAVQTTFSIYVMQTHII